MSFSGQSEQSRDVAEKSQRRVDGAFQAVCAIIPNGMPCGAYRGSYMSVNRRSDKGKRGGNDPRIINCDPAECLVPGGENPADLIAGDRSDEGEQKPGLLLHSCCGPCSTSVIKTLAGEFDITVFYYNPCITEEEEYIRRRDTQKEFIEEYNMRHPGQTPVRIIEGVYNPGSFLNMIRGTEDEPEGGKRCLICFEQRLEKTAETAKLQGFDYFATTLTVSPHKNYGKISEIGRMTALRYGITFLDRDFKKKDGYKRSIEMSKTYELYRQNYCGCRFSKR